MAPARPQDTPEPDDAGRPDGSARVLAASLGLEAHPEGGWFRRVWTSSSAADPAGDTPRAGASSILYLLEGDDRSAWHRLTDAEEVWIHQSGDPVRLHVSPDGMTEQVVLLGPPTIPDAVPVAVVGVGHWQSAERFEATATDGSPSNGPAVAPTPDAGWSLLVCVVSPEFRFEHFELAPPCWEPGGDQV